MIIADRGEHSRHHHVHNSLLLEVLDGGEDLIFVDWSDLSPVKVKSAF